MYLYKYINIYSKYKNIYNIYTVYIPDVFPWPYSYSTRFLFKKPFLPLTRTEARAELCIQCIFLHSFFSGHFLSYVPLELSTEGYMHNTCIHYIIYIHLWSWVAYSNKCSTETEDRRSLSLKILESKVLISWCWFSASRMLSWALSFKKIKVIKVIFVSLRRKKTKVLVHHRERERERYFINANDELRQFCRSRLCPEADSRGRVFLLRKANSIWQICGQRLVCLQWFVRFIFSNQRPKDIKTLR